MRATAMTCRRCKTAKAAGRIFCLCEPCFDWFAAKVDASWNAGSAYRPTDSELEYINEPFIRRAN